VLNPHHCCHSALRIAGAVTITHFFHREWGTGKVGAEISLILMEMGVLVRPIATAESEENAD
jgi:hypothetical protein